MTRKPSRRATAAAPEPLEIVPVEESEMLPRIYDDSTGTVYVPLPRPHKRLEREAPIHFFTPYLDHIERMAAQGMQPKDIAARFGLSAEALQSAITVHPDVAAAMRSGLARGLDEASSVIARGIAAGDVTAAALLLKARGGYNPPPREVQAPSVTINMGSQPAPITIDHVASMAERHKQVMADYKARVARTQIGPSDQSDGPQRLITQKPDD